MPFAASWSRTTFSCRDRVWMAYQKDCSTLSANMPVLSPLSADTLQCCCSLWGTPKVSPRDEAIARRYDTIAYLANSLRGLDRFHLYLAPPVIRIFMIL